MDNNILETRHYSKQCIRFDLYKNKTKNFDFLAEGLINCDSHIDVETGGSGFKIRWNDKCINIAEMSLFEKKINGTDTSGARLVFEVERGIAYYGLGQQQNNLLDYAGSVVEVFHNYKAKGGETIGIPVLITDAGFALILNTPTQTIIDLTKDGIISWEMDCSNDISFIVAFADSMRGLYKEIKNVLGTIPLPLKSSLGYIQCKQRYESQDELMGVARKYREKEYPVDMMVVDWFYWEHLGDMDLWNRDWPDPRAMTQELKSLNMDCMISVWPRFMKESKHYNELEEKGYFVKDEKGRTVYGTEEDQRGALIDTTNAAAGKWYWEIIKQNLASKGFNAWWTDEDEPDLWPYDYTLAAGKGYEIFNLYPYTHIKAIYEGHRRDCNNRCCILSRSAFLGAAQFGTQFWSSDIYPTWGVLKKQVPTMINFCASGMGYWSSDIGGWQSLPDYKGRSSFTASELLLETQGSTEGVVLNNEYAELYIRWFQFGTFSPIFRAHGTRDENEVWSYGKQAEEIMAKYLKLRYELMPYIYSMSYELTKDNTPLVRGLFFDFQDEKCRDIKDEYMFGDAILVAPVVEKGATNRVVYLPQGCNWYDFYTYKEYVGGQEITIESPLSMIPLFVKENSIIPMQKPVQSTKEKVDKIYLKLFGRNKLENANFILYEDDGVTYEYENKVNGITNITIENGSVLVSGARGLEEFEVIFTLT